MIGLPAFQPRLRLASGVNVNHVGRVFVAAMARSIGIPIDVACSMFEGAPDYDLKQRPTKLAMSTSANIRLMPVQHSRQRQGVRSLREMIGYAIKSG